ncbi:MAG: endo alpha,4 polygalactosaminidase, partial [Acidimicrobiales bacterium]|nr:endo alpha,4 polygalactosaminidase [Acidimicrobiales bacterium]
NDLEQVASLAGKFDFGVNEGCLSWRECPRLRPYLDQGKPVLHLEYSKDQSAICGNPARAGLSTLLKNESLDAWRLPCPS